MKIIRRKFSMEYLLMIVGKERHIPRTEIIDGALPDDAKMFHLSFDPPTNCIDMFFYSDKEGTEVMEGASIYSIESDYATFRTIATIPTEKVKEAIENFLIKIDVKHGDWTAFKKELGLK